MNYSSFKKGNHSCAEYYVNEFKYINGCIYYTVIDGTWSENDYYFNPNLQLKLQLKRININNDQIKIINPTGYQKFISS